MNKDKITNEHKKALEMNREELKKENDAMFQNLKNQFENELFDRDELILIDAKVKSINTYIIDVEKLILVNGIGSLKPSKAEKLLPSYIRFLDWLKVRKIELTKQTTTETTDKKKSKNNNYKHIA